MLIFDQLRISDNGKRMYINIHVNDADYFNDVTLKSITITTADKVLESYGANGTSPTVIATDYIYHKEFGSGLRKADLVLDKGSFDAAFAKLDNTTATIEFNGDFSKSLFFVYVECQGLPADTTPCRLDESVTLGVTFDTTALYQKVMGYTRELADTCEIPKNFIDFILNYNAFKAAVETEHYIPAIKFFNQMFDRFDNKTTFKCGCRG